MNAWTPSNSLQPQRPKLFWSVARDYLELIRFSHTIFALPFAALAVVWSWMVPFPDGASAPNSIGRWVGVLLCMVTARSFAMAWNRWADADIDRRNQRTASRHIPAGKLKGSSVFLFACLCAIGFLLSCTLFLPNWLPILLAIPVLFFLAGYSYAKRFTWLAHHWLGAALMMAPICAWIAMRGEVVQVRLGDLTPAVLLGTAVLFWVSGFDILYACQDAEFDRRAKLHSIPARFGVRGALRIAAICHAAMWCVLWTMGWFLPELSLGWIWSLSVLAIGGLLVYEHSIVRPEDLTKVNVAFFQVNALISMVLLAVGSLDALLR